jgi:MFS family permease
MLAAGQALSWLGNGFQTVALAVAVVLSGGGAGDLGVVLASAMVARVACTLFGGVWADRLQPRTVMAASDLVRFAAVGGMAAQFAAGYDGLALLCGLAAVASGAGAFFAPAMTSLKPLVMTVGQRQSANATLSLLQNGALIAGPAAGGVVVAAAGAPAGFAVNAATFGISVLSVLLIRTRADRAAPRQGMLHELRGGWSEIRDRDWLLSGVLAATGYHVANGVVLVLAQVVAVRELGGASAVGIIAAAEGAGGVLGALIAMRLRPRRYLRAGWLALLLMPLWVLGYVWPGVLGAVVAGAIIGYGGLFYFDVAWETAIQDHVPHHALARVASWDTMASFVGMPLGNALAGPLAAAFGTHSVLIVCATVLFGSGLVPLCVAGTRTLTRPPADSPQPAPALA